MLTEERRTRFLSGGELSLLGNCPCCRDTTLNHQMDEHERRQEMYFFSWRCAIALHYSWLLWLLLWLLPRHLLLVWLWLTGRTLHARDDV